MRTTDALKQADSIAGSRANAATNVNLPNFLTVARILLIPVFVVLFSDPTPDRSLIAALIFIIAAVTDLLDGYLARRHSQVTRLGRLLDPIADKLLVLSALILLVEFDRVHPVVAILIIAREVAVTSVRGLAAPQGIIMEAETMGKYKMAVQVVAIVFLLLERGVLPDTWHAHDVGTVLLYLALALAFYSGTRYLMTFWQQSSKKGL